MSLPAQIRALMRNTVTWERFIGQDGHADEKYAEPVPLKCWIEVKTGGGGLQRRSGVGLTTVDPEADVYLDAGDVDAGAVTIRDRFTYTLNGQGFKTQADQIAVTYGPDSSPWMIVVSL